MEDLALMRGLFGSAFEGQRVLVTGATGFKGSWLCCWLRQLGASVRGLSLDVPTEPSHFAVLNLAKDIEDLRVDVRDASTTAKSIRDFRPDYVFHLAAQSLVRRSYADPAATFSTNILGTVHVLDALRDCPSARAAVIVTSDKCYENVEQAAGYTENDRIGGKDPYSGSKGAAEIVFSSFARSYFGATNRSTQGQPTHLRLPLVASARAGNVIGGGDWASDRIVPDCVNAWHSGRTPVIRSPNATRPWQHVLEPLSGYLWLAALLGSGDHTLHGESFNFGPKEEVDESVLTLIRELRRHWPEAAEPEVHPPPALLHEAGLLRLDCAKAKRKLAWSPTLEFTETARLTAEWFRTFAEDPAKAPDTTRAQITEYIRLARARGLTWASSP